MVFSSIIFLFFFLPFALAIYFFPFNRWRNSTLVALSFLFYAWSEREYTAVLVLSIAANYLIASALVRANRPAGEADSGREGDEPVASGRSLRKLTLSLGIIFNIGLLAFFKYTNFLVGNINHVAVWLHAEPLAIGKVYAPVGISFFTFHALSYCIDIYRSKAATLRSPLDLGLYISFFPKILAGPIIQYHDAENQLGPRPVTGARFLAGVERFVLGMAKKVLIASPLAAAADKAFAVPAPELTAGIAWLGIVCYTLQILFDFAGYSDMAIGLAKMFGFDLPENFNYPYISQSIQEFWRRWHISLSTWFRDYLYIPLGGSRCPVRRQYFNLTAVFLLCGLWHGASWNFIIWGLWYGVFLVLERAGLSARLLSVRRPVRHCYALAVVVIGWVFFRSETLSYAMAYLGAMFGLGGGAGVQYHSSLFWDNEVALCILIGALASLPLPAWLRGVFLPARPSEGLHSRELPPGLASVYAIFLGALFFLSCISLAGGTQKSFIYFQF